MKKERFNKIVFDENEIKYIIDRYTNGISIKNIANHFGVSESPISNLLKLNNIHIKSDVEKSLKYSCNNNFFCEIDTEEKAYWLGFIYADGYITKKTKHGNRKFGVALSIKDIEHLKKLKSSLKSNHKICVYKSVSGYSEGLEYCRLIITSIDITDALLTKGVLEEKTNVVNFPSSTQVPNDLLRHFIRGYMDGDGSITITKNKVFDIKICGTSELLNGIQSYFTDACEDVNFRTLQKRHKDRDVNNYTLQYGGNRQVEKLLDLLYSDATVYLDRKYCRYIKLKEANKNMDIYLQNKTIVKVYLKLIQ